MINRFAKLAQALALILALAMPVTATDLAGTFKAPNGSPVVNGSLSLTLSQAGVIAGDFSVTTSPVSCYTSTDGSIVGVPNPLVAPVVTPSTASGTISAGTWYVRISYYTLDDMMMVDTESLPSAATTAVLSGTGKFTITQPTLQPSNADGYRVYIGTSAGATKLQATTDFGSNTVVTSYDSMGASVASENDSVCAVAGNDTIIPSYTFYRVSAANAQGAFVPGFPQNWYLAGDDVDISDSLPLAAVAQQTRFPTPLLANPSANAQQSVASPVTLNGYPLTAGALILPDNADPPTCTAGRVTVYSSSGSLVICEGTSAVSGLAGNTYKSAAMTGGNATVTTEVDLAGATVSLDRVGYWLVVATCDIGITSDAAVGYCYMNFDGSNDSAVMALQTDTDSEIGATVGNSWIVQVTAQPKVVKLRGKRNSGTGTVTIYQTHTNVKAVWISE